MVCCRPQIIIVTMDDMKKGLFLGVVPWQSAWAVIMVLRSDLGPSSLSFLSQRKQLWWWTQWTSMKLEKKFMLKRKICQQNTILFLPFESCVRCEGQSFQRCHFSSVIHNANHPLISSYKHANCATVGGCCLFVIPPVAAQLMTSHLESRHYRSMLGRCKCFRGSESG